MAIEESDGSGHPRRPGWRGLLVSPAVVGTVLSALVLAAAVVVGVRVTQHSAAAPTAFDASAARAGVDVSLREMSIQPAKIAVPAGSHLVLRVTNNGTIHHDLRLSSGKQTAMLAPGQTATLDVGTVSASLKGWCTVPGHRQSGMQLSIVIAQPSSASAGPSAAGSGPASTGMAGMADMGTPASDPASGTDAVSPNLAADPGAGWKAPDASLPAVPSGTVHDVTWHIKNVTRSVAPGVQQQLWTFDGSVPGPVLHGRVGDTFNVTVVNDTAMEHNLDFHAESGPPAKVMVQIPPGGSHTYRFVAEHAGAWLYHCGTEPMLQHMGNGMYGALIIDPPGLHPVGAEYVLVGSELFFGPQGQSGDYPKMLADKPDAVVFNGYPFAYAHSPLPAKVGQPVRIWLVDAGPSRALSFHVVGASFNTVYIDGHYELDAGNAADGAAQTLPVDPGDGGFVELTFDQPGTYPFLTHDMADAARGATGAIEVGR